MGLNLLADTARLKRIAAILQEGAEAPPLPAAIDLVNRAIRPGAVLAVFAGLATAFLDPPRYLAGMVALAMTPMPVAAAAAAVVALHFLRFPAGKAAVNPTVPAART